MKTTMGQGVFVLAAMLALVGQASAQKPVTAGMANPRLFTCAPAGAQAGSTVELVLTGIDLEDAQGLHFSHPGFKVEVLGAIPVDPKKPPPKPAPQTVAVRFKVTVPANAPPGIHDVRLVNKWGVSNPRAFVVGDLKELEEKESNNDVNEAQKLELNNTVNGAISAGTDVDYFTFAGKKGQKVIVSCLAASIDSRLHPAIEVYDKGGLLLATNRNYQGTDALLDFTPPADDAYTVRLFAFAYTQGSNEHFYRLTITTAPWIDAVYPPVVEPGKTSKVTVLGRNLPNGKTDEKLVVDGRALEKAIVGVKAPADTDRLTYRGYVPPYATGLDGFEYRLKNAAGASNGVLLTYAAAPVVLDNEDNDTSEKAQAVNLPAEIVGRIEKKRDRDWYAFTAKKGDIYSIELYGHRLGSAMDTYFTLRNAQSKQVITEQDDNPDLLSPTQFFTRSEDPPRYRFQAPADGKFELQVSSREAEIEASPRHIYRVRVTPEKPDFRLIVMPQAVNSPDSCVLHQGGNQYYSVFVWRQDGFNGEIALTVEGLPAGVKCPAQVVGTGMKQATLVLSADETAAAWTGEIQVKGTAKINEKPITHEARAATITWPIPQGQVAPTISRMDRSLVLAVRDQAPFRLSSELEEKKIVPGEKVTIPVKVARSADAKAPLLLTALNLPPGMTAPGNNQPVNLAADKDSMDFVLTVGGNVAPGVYTIVIRGQATVPYSKDGKQKTPVNVIGASTPITLIVEAKKK